MAKHIGVDIQPEVRHVVKMLACYKPDDFTYLTVRIVRSQAGKGFWFNSLILILGQFNDVVECRTFRIGKKGSSSGIARVHRIWLDSSIA